MQQRLGAVVPGCPAADLRAGKFGGGLIAQQVAAWPPAAGARARIRSAAGRRSRGSAGAPSGSPVVAVRVRMECVGRPSHSDGRAGRRHAGPNRGHACPPSGSWVGASGGELLDTSVADVCRVDVPLAADRHATGEIEDGEGAIRNPHLVAEVDRRPGLRRDPGRGGSGKMGLIRLETQAANGVLPA